MPKLPENTVFEGAVGALVTLNIGGKECVILQKRAADDSFPGCLQVTMHGGLDRTDDGTRERVMVGLMREVVEETAEILSRSSLRETVDEGTLGQRMTIEDVGSKMYQASRANRHPWLCADVSILGVSKKTKHPKPDSPDVPVRKTDITFGARLPSNYSSDHPSFLVGLRTLAQDGVIVLLSADQMDTLVPLDPKLHKKDGLQEEGKYGMFQDEIDAVKKVFEKDGCRFVTRN